jgi:hypothetical protein
MHAHLEFQTVTCQHMCYLALRSEHTATGVGCHCHLFAVELPPLTTTAHSLTRSHPPPLTTTTAYSLTRSHPPPLTTTTAHSLTRSHPSFTHTLAIHSLSHSVTHQSAQPPPPTETHLQFATCGSQCQRDFAIERLDWLTRPRSTGGASRTFTARSKTLPRYSSLHERATATFLGASSRTRCTIDERCLVDTLEVRYC